MILPFTVLPFGISTVTGSPTFASLCLVASRSTVTTSCVEVVCRIAVALLAPEFPELFEFPEFHEFPEFPELLLPLPELLGDLPEFPLFGEPPCCRIRCGPPLSVARSRPEAARSPPSTAP